MKSLLTLALTIYFLGCTRGESKEDPKNSKSVFSSLATGSEFPTFIDIQLGAKVSILTDRKELSSCKESTDVHPDDTNAGVKVYNCGAINISIEKAKLTFFKDTLMKAEYFVKFRDDYQERMRRAFVQKFGQPDEDVSKKALTTSQYPAEVLSTPYAFNSVGVFEKWKKSTWRAYTASFKEKMYYIEFINTVANDELVKVLKGMEEDKSKQDLKDLKI